MSQSDPGIIDRLGGYDPLVALDEYNPRRLPLVITLIFFFTFLMTAGALVVGTFVFNVGAASRITFARVIEVLTRPSTTKVVLDTLWIGIGGGIIATTMGSIYAWILVRTNAPGKKFLRLVIVLPLAMPFIVKGVGWIAMLAPGFGIINRLWPFGTLFNLYSLEGIIIAFGVGGLPLSFLIMEPAVRSISPALEEGSQIAGRGLISTFFRVVLPMLKPALLSSFILIAIYGFGNFDYPFLFGATQSGLDTLATEIYFVIYGSPIPKYDVATILSLIYVAIAAVAILIYWTATKQSHRFETVSGQQERQTVHDLGAWRYPASALCFLMWATAFLIPFTGMLAMSFASNISKVFTSFTLTNYVDFLGISVLSSVIFNTLVAALGAALGVAFFSVFISYTTLKSDFKYSKIGDITATIPLSFPPIVYGLAIYWMILLVPGLGATYGTILPLILALIFVRLPHGVRIVSSNLIQISDELEEASQSVGASWFHTFRNVTIPLLKNGIANSFLYTFIDSMRELGAIVLLITAGNNVFTGLLLRMYSQSASALPTVAAGSVILVGIILVFVIIYMRIGGGVEQDY